MRLRLLLLMLLAAGTPAEAGTMLRYGVGILGSAEYGAASVKTLSLGVVEDWFGPLTHQYEVGAYTDASGQGRRSSGFGFYTVGVEVKPSDILARSLFGVGSRR